MLIVLSLNVIVFIAIAVALFWKYRLTRDAGFLWFSAAIVVWPLVSAGLRSLAKGSTTIGVSSGWGGPCRSQSGFQVRRFGRVVPVGEVGDELERGLP